MPRTTDAVRITALQQQLDAERRQRLAAESRLGGLKSAVLRSQVKIAEQRAELLKLKATQTNGG
jgi:hypothetical protein